MKIHFQDSKQLPYLILIINHWNNVWIDFLLPESVEINILLNISLQMFCKL